jgi:hypothetical protein
MCSLCQGRNHEAASPGRLSRPRLQDAGFAGYVQGYRIAGGTLHPITGSLRSLGLGNGNPPAFLQSPSQVGFTPVAASSSSR